MSVTYGHSTNIINDGPVIDTIYYNSEWKIVSTEIIADYYRVTVEPDKQFRDYFITGELQARGGYIRIDSLDDRNSIFNGKCITYYKNGSISSEKSYLEGDLSGEYIEYNKNGLIERHMNFLNDKLNGIFTEFKEDNSCIQTEYTDGIPNNYYTVSNVDGCIMKFDTKSNEPIWESPDVSEIKTEYTDGIAYSFYSKNGLIIGLTNTSVKDYGRYYRVELVISNYSLDPIEFDPTLDIAATAINKKQEENDICVLSSDKYMKKVKRSQNWKAALVGFAEGLSTVNAGYQTSTTTTNTHSSGSAYASGTNGSAYGSYSGRSTSVSTTKQYDAAAAYQARVISNNRIANFESSLITERQVKDEGYLKRTTIYPSEVVSGYVHIDRSSRDKSVTVIIDINGIKYEFYWENEERKDYDSW